MTNPANPQPISVKLKANQTYSYCPCFLTKTPPWCDMSHRGRQICPITLEVERDSTVMLCQCGKSSNKPYCDGSHQSVDLLNEGHRI